MGMAQFNPMNTMGNFGNFGFGGNQATAGDSASQAMMRAMLGPAMMSQIQGGMFNDPRFQAGLEGADLSGSVNQLNQASQMFASPEMASQLGNVNNLADFFSQRAQGPMQDLSGGMMGDMFSRGQGFLNQAQDTQGLYDGSLDVMRRAAQPFMDRQQNKLTDKLHAMGMLGSSGGAQQMGGLLEAQGQQDLGFQNQAFDRTQQRQSLLGNLGMQAMGQGQGFLGQNLAGRAQDIGAAQGFNQLGSGIENQFFQNQLAGINQQQQGANMRMQNAMGMYGLGNNMFNSAFGNAMQAGTQMQGMDQMQMQGLLGLLNNAVGRIDATGAHAGALSQIGQSQGGLFGGLFNGLFS
jgi:hypothetical protein